MQFIDLKKQQSLIRENLEKRLRIIFDHGKYIMGPEVLELEKILADYVSAKYCITCSSGTDALLIPLLSKNIGPGDAVLTSPFSYIATAEVIALVGATPIFVDIYESTYNIDPQKIDKAINFAISRDLNPKAIIPVDLFGLPARHRLIREKADEYGLFFIDDAAQGFGGQIGSKLVGSFGDVTATSFFPAKPLGCYGDGGAIFTDNDELAEIMRSVRIHGGGVNKYQNIRVGLNGRLDTIQAAILLEKFTIFKDEVIARNKVADYYRSKINQHLIIPFTPKNYTSSWAQFSLLAKSNKERNLYMGRLKKENIPSMIYYPTPLHMQPVFQHLKYCQGDFPVAEKISNSIFSIPMHPYLKKEEQDNIINVLNSKI